MSNASSNDPVIELRKTFEALRDEGLVERLSYRTSRALLDSDSAQVGLEDEAFAKHLAMAFRDEILAILEAACYWRYLNTEALRPTIFESESHPSSMDWQGRCQRTLALERPASLPGRCLDALTRLAHGEPPSLGVLAQIGYDLQARDCFSIYRALDLLAEEQLDAAGAILQPIHSGLAQAKNSVTAAANLGFICYEQKDFARGLRLYRKMALSEYAPLGPTLDWLYGGILSANSQECRAASHRLEELDADQASIAQFARRRHALRMGGSIRLDRNAKKLLRSLPISSLAQPVIEALA